MSAMITTRTKVLCTQCFRRQIGILNDYAKLTEEDIRSIFSMRRSGMKQREIGEEFGIDQAHVSAVL